MAAERPLPLHRFPLVCTESLEELEQVQAKVNSPIQAERLHPRAGFKWRANRIVFDRLAIMVSYYEQGAVAHVPDIGSLYSLILPVRGLGEVRQAGRVAPLVPGEKAVLVSPFMPADFTVSTGYEGIQVMIPQGMMEGALNALLGDAGRRPLRFELALDMAELRGASVRHLLEFIIAESDREGAPLQGPIVTGHLCQALIHSILQSQPHNHSNSIHAQARCAEPYYVTKIEDFLAANCEQSTTLADLTHLTGVSARAIHAGFRAHRGYTPMAFLRERRLELARDRLSSVPDTTVTAVGLDCGFEHLGRFCIIYRTRFGESPLATLRRCRDAAKMAR